MTKRLETLAPSKATDSLSESRTSGGRSAHGEPNENTLLVKMRLLRKQAPDDDFEWAKRGAYWGKKSVNRKRKHAGQAADLSNPPLVLAGHGVTLKIHHGSLVVQNGFTHYSQEREQWRFFPGARSLPSRIILLEADGGLSFDVISWLSKQNIPLVLLNYLGEIVSVMGGEGRGLDLGLIQLQREAKTNGNDLKLASWLIQEKIRGCIETLLTLLVSSARESAIWKLRQSLKELEQPPENMETLRLCEGRAALSYFHAWRDVRLQWKGTGRNPIPREWDRMVSRQSSPTGSNRNARHPINSILNYAFGVLESQVRTAIQAAGLDPMLGYLHACSPGRVALVYDMMEPLRPRSERLVLEFLQRQTFSPHDFIMLDNGVCRLHPQLAKVVSRIAVDEQTVESLVAQVIEKLGNNPTKN